MLESSFSPQFNEQPASGKVQSERHLLFTKELAASYWRVYGCILSIVPDRNDADDVMQEVGILLWQKFDQFELGTSFTKWACTIAFHTSRSFARKKRQHTGVALSDETLRKLAVAHSGVSELLELRRMHLASCVSQLADKDRKFLLTCESRHGSVADMARDAKVPAHRLYKKLNRLRQNIADCIRRSLGGGDEI
ncbi:sigma-70 family RNA polymerase sigma factor [Calycomorphotria hydatis]|uniref:RNA polymerase sigma factor n=1 Tax=Calycomorphotria hydatis TaxID=2528027 RepID=A0A517TAL6_9PLAN|nr:sigma-70 family RNA polymerase sigma factor [Calycomorphotria hydatis]QDT65417.1 RNA polymerase sigma factor [Calycomorphotria hydatis]